MKTRIAIFAAMIVALCGASLRAQPAQVAASKIAVFDSDALGDDKTGAKKLIAAFRQLDGEFKEKGGELRALRAKYDALMKSVDDTRSTADPVVIRKKLDEAESIKLDIERKQQDGQKALEKRTKELTDPIYQEINTELMAYTKARGYDMVFDVSKLAGIAIVLNPAIDITTAFIAEYNTKHPLVPTGVPVKTP